jgi:thymidine kinase
MSKDRILQENLSERSLKDLFAMIPERRWRDENRSKIELIVGSMYSGKTEEMIRRIKRERLAKFEAQIFKPLIDDRYGGIRKVNSHSGHEDDAIPVANARGILINLITNNELKNVVAIGIDEAQFFDQEIVDVVLGLRSKGFRLEIAGLNLDFRGELFGPMPSLLSHAEEITKLNAVCTSCGKEAYYTQRIVNGKPAHYDDPIIMVGASEAYEARCADHHIVPGKGRMVPKQGE